MRSFFSAALAFGVASAKPLEVSDYIRAATNTPAGQSSSSTQTEPCSLINNALATGPTDPRGNTIIDPDLALACLQSVPLDVKGDTLQMAGLRAFVEFQSTLEYLEDPPEGFLYPAVDIRGGVEELAARLKTSYYSNEYDFQMDVMRVVNSAYDEHFNYPADITSIFYFRRALKLFSLSKDGLSLPEIYANTDVGALAYSNLTHYTPSPITKINGVNVEEWLNDYASINGNAQDPDANYNNNLYNIPTLTPSGAGSAAGAFAGSVFYQGNSTVLTFANGTSIPVLTYATTNECFKGVTNGKTFFQRFCTGPKKTTPCNVPSSTSNTTGNTGPRPDTTQVPYVAVPTETSARYSSWYPKAVSYSSDYYIAGFLPEELPDTAVLAIPNFGPDTALQIEFENTARELFATAKAAGKTKLIIDLRGNGGGTVLLAYDLFHQLFPSIAPVGITNFRAHALFNETGVSTSAYFANYTAETAPKSLSNTGFDSVFNFREELDAMYRDFDSWEDFYGPKQIHGGNFTNLVRYNLSDHWQTSDVPVYGYSNDTLPQPQTFEPENIILLQDGKQHFASS